jgi:hypothetical protein
MVCHLSLLLRGRFDGYPNFDELAVIQRGWPRALL